MFYDLMSPNFTPILIEFQNGRPFSVITKDGVTFDCDWCERDGVLYWHASGGGLADDVLHPDGGGDVWIAPGYRLEEGVINGVLTECPQPFDRHPSQWENVIEIEEDETEYCSICHDHLPHENLCEHVYFSEHLGMYCGPGQDEAGYLESNGYHWCDSPNHFRWVGIDEEGDRVAQLPAGAPCPCCGAPLKTAKQISQET